MGLGLASIVDVTDTESGGPYGCSRCTGNLGSSIMLQKDAFTQKSESFVFDRGSTMIPGSACIRCTDDSISLWHIVL